MTCVVLAKRPEPGRVKTRLVPPLTHEQAATLAAAALADTLDAMALLPGRRLLAFAGDPEGWLRDGWALHRQPSGGLDARLGAAFDAAAALAPDDPAVLVGMDTPQLMASQLAAFDPQRYDACLGRAADGGFWAIGFRDPSQAAGVIAGVPMSSPHTGAVQLERLLARGWRVQLLDQLTDVDTVDTAREVAALAPHTAFGAAFAAVRAVA